MKLQIRRLDGSTMTIEGELLHKMTAVNGFRRSYIGMHVVRTPEGELLAMRVDTVAQIEVAMFAQEMQDLAGFFGYDPLAISFYRAMAINVRAAA